RAHSGFQVPVSRRYYADVDGNRLITPDPLQLSFLEYSQEGKLCLGRKLADLVKENRPAIGGFEASCASLKRPGKGTFFVAEKFGSNQRGRNDRAINANKCPRRAPGPLMDGTGNQFLSRTGLAQNQHRGIGRGHLVN